MASSLERTRPAFGNRCREDTDAHRFAHQRGVQTLTKDDSKIYIVVELQHQEPRVVVRWRLYDFYHMICYYMIYKCRPLQHCLLMHRI